MPQLVKGGKYAYGESKVSATDETKKHPDIELFE
jgi:hypothetical protein